MKKMEQFLIYLCTSKILEWVAVSLLQGIFPTKGSDPSLPHCRWIPYQLSQQGNPRILEWVAYPFSRGSSQPRNQTGVPCIAGGFFTSWATREAPYNVFLKIKWIRGKWIKNMRLQKWSGRYEKKKQFLCIFLYIKFLYTLVYTALYIHYLM